MWVVGWLWTYYIYVWRIAETPNLKIVEMISGTTTQAEKSMSCLGEEIMPLCYVFAEFMEKRWKLFLFGGLDEGGFNHTSDVG